MSLRYSNTNLIKQDLPGTLGTRRELCDGIVAALTAAGWTTVSGAGTAVVKMQSLLTPQALNMRVLISDPGSGNCATLTLSNASGSLTQTVPLYLCPGPGVVFRVLANSYQAFIFAAGSTTARRFASFGCLYIHSFNSITEAIWGNATAISDADTTVRPSWRNCSKVAAAGDAGQFWNATNGSAYGRDTGSSVSPGCQALICARQQWGTGIVEYFDGSTLIQEPLVSWAAANQSAAPKVNGTLWDCALVGALLPLDSLQTFDGKTWQVVGVSDGSWAYPASLLHVIP